MVGMNCHNSNTIDGSRETPFTMFYLECNTHWNIWLCFVARKTSISFDLFLEVMALLQESLHSLQHVGLASFDISLLLVGLYGVDFLLEFLDLDVSLGEGARCCSRE